MPTGYTAPIYEGTPITFREFTLRCARAMGALILLRDESMDAPLPEEFEPRTEYHDTELAKAKARMSELQAMTAEQIVVAHAAERAEQLRARTKELLNHRAMRARYDAMIEQAEAWFVGPPLDGLRTFMLDQLREGRDFDCPEKPYLSDLASGDPVEWYQAQIDKAQWSITYHTDEIAKEKDRARERTQWLNALRSALPHEASVDA